MSLQAFALRVLAAFIAGSLIGLERQINGRPAGLRTHVLVCTGAAIAVMGGVLATGLYPDLGMDTGRIAAGVITGIGFLGAGTIVRYREGVGGLTTAACIWFVAMAGILAGLGFYVQLLLVITVALVVLILLDRLEDHLNSASYWRLEMVFAGRAFQSLNAECIRMIRRNRFSVKSSTVSVKGERTELVFVLRTRFRRDSTRLIDAAGKTEGLVSLKWTHRTEAM